MLGHGEVHVEHLGPAVEKKYCKEMEDKTQWFYVIMPEYGISLEDYFDYETLTEVEVLKIGLQLLHQLEAIHMAGFVHGDIKPANIVIGQSKKSEDKTNRVRLVDFGISSMYVKQNGRAYSESEQFRFKGTLMFCSLHTMKRQHLTQRDDLISLTYMLLYLLDEFPIPMKHYETIQEDFKYILEAKEKLTVDDMVKGPKSKMLRAFIEEVFGLEFNKVPYYKKLRHMLTVQLLNKETVPTEDIFGNQKQGL